MLLAFTLIGLAFQLAGAGVVWWGARLILREAATGGEGLLDPAIALAQRSWHRATGSLLRWFGRPRSQTIQVGGIDSAEMAGSVRVSKSYSPLTPDVSLTDAVAELDRRTQALINELGHAEGRVLEKLEEQGKRHDDLSRAFDQYVSDQDKHVRRRDLRGVRFEAGGLALVTVGAILQAFGALLAPTPDGSVG